ncbi:MAG: YgjV family protein [Clostridia bacterium]|nr:YgjV family protein [Clostridia bacterium]MBO4885528.1 YgjV family protein [Clostridia bacterium]
MTTEYVLIQAVGIIGTVLFFFSFQCRKNRNLFRVQFLSYLFYTVHLLLLGAVTGGISYLINLFRSFCLGSRWEFARRKEMCAVICLMQVAALFFTWSGWISLLPVLANIASTIGGYTHNARKIRIAGMMINSPLWIIYDIIVGSWAGILDEAVSEASMIISVVRYGWKNLDQDEE